MPPVTPNRSPRLNGEFWDVKPYRFLSELRDRYTETVLSATQKRAESIADEATTWMRQHAPWQDREPDPERGIVGGSARKGLRAVVLKNEADVARYDQMRAQAQNQDTATLVDMREARRQRIEAAEKRTQLIKEGRGPIIRVGKPIRKGLGSDTPYMRILDLGLAPDPKRAERYRKQYKSRKWYRRIHSVPKSRSAVAKMESNFRGQVPLVDVRFTHNTRLAYVIWLEIANQGRYAIISRTLAHFGPKLFGEIKKIATLKQYRDKIALGPERNTAEQEFWAYADRETQRLGREYEPWSPRKQRERNERRRRYREGGKERMQEQERAAREYREGLGQPKTRGAQPSQYSGPTFNLSASRTGRR